MTLKPCPFCGGEVRRYNVQYINAIVFVCDQCQASTHFDGIKSQEETIKKWNTRAELIPRVPRGDGKSTQHLIEMLEEIKGEADG